MQTENETKKVAKVEEDMDEFYLMDKRTKR